MSKNPANRGLGDHLKQGLKNVPKTYKALYNAKGMGPIQTAKHNVKLIVKGDVVENKEGQKISPGTRAKVAMMGAASITPVGPLAMIADGIKKSVTEKKKAIEHNKPGNVEKRALEEGKVIKKSVPTMPVPPKPEAPKTPPTVNTFKKPLAPSPNVRPLSSNPMGTNRKGPTKK